MTRREKKSESLEIRLEYSKKTSFMQACSERGQTASGVLRSAIEDYIQGAGRSLRMPVKYINAAGAFVCLLILSSSYEMPASDSANIILGAFDSNSDTYLTATDARDESRKALFHLLENADVDENGRVTAQELDAFNPVMFRIENEGNLPAGKPVFLNFETKDLSKDRILLELAKVGITEELRETLSPKIAMAADRN